MTSIFSTSCAASVLMSLYVCMACFNLYSLMYPLTFVDLTTIPSERMVHPLWETEEKMHMRVYLSTQKAFGRKFVDSEFVSTSEDPLETSSMDTMLLWKQDIDSASLSKSFLLTSIECMETGTCADTDKDPSLKQAEAWLDHSDEMLLQHDGGVLSTIQAAGQGIESTSILLTIYQSFSQKVKSLLAMLSLIESQDFQDQNHASKGFLERSTVYLPFNSPMWSSLMSNTTIYVHVIVTRKKFDAVNAKSPDEAAQIFGQAQRSHSLLTGKVGLIKFDEPNHLSKPGRILYMDLVYLARLYLLGTVDQAIEKAPWDMEYAKPDYYTAYKRAQKMKEEGAGYPYWKPEVAIKYLIDTESYPYDRAHVSGMSFVQVTRSPSHQTGVAHIPALHVDEIGLTSEKYIPVNRTISSLPLHITFDRSDILDETKAHATTATSGGISPARWRLLTHLSQSIEAQKDLGFDQSDIDDLRRLIADTNVTLLTITILASALHLLFEFLTFKNEVSFWNNNTDLTGLSVRSLFLDMIGQVVIVLYLIEKDSSLLMTVPSVIGCLIALWKCQRAAGLAFVRVGDEDLLRAPKWWNRIPRMIGYDLRATRLEGSRDEKGNEHESGTEARDGGSKNGNDLHSLSLECDRIATKNLGMVLLPLVAAYTFYSLVMEEHSGWYSWLITSASSAVYALGFVLMTPQLFLNYKLKSVAHLPWRVLVYKSLNTFIDDLFSFIIRMPTMARISCFRDDVVFFVYLYQRWLYPVDKSRPVEGGGDGTENATDLDVKKNQ